MSVKKLIVALALSAGIFSASTASAAILVNGSFEATTDPELGNPDWDVFASIPGWTKFDDTAGIEVQRGNIGGSTAYHGLNKVELDSHGTNSNSGMSQTVTLDAGSYEFSFAYLGRNNTVGTNQINYDVVGTTVVGFEDSLRGDGTWTIVKVLFDIAADSTEATVNFWAQGTEDTLGGYIDDVKISAVPLPPAMLLFGAAMVGLGWVGRRRKTSAV